MKQNLEAVARQVETFLDLAPLDDAEMADVLKHCSFQWMSDNFDLFEMQVPHLLQDAPGFFKSGRADRYRDIPHEISQRISHWCDEQLQREDLAISQWYDNA